MRVSITLKNKTGQIALDQIRCVDKSRLFDRIESLDKESIQKLKSILSEYLIE